MNRKTIVIVLTLLAFSAGAALLALPAPNPLPNQYTYRPDNDYDTITWGHKVVKNSFGFRERELPPKSNAFRIMVVGDSLTWGAGISENDRYTRLLELHLATKFAKRRIEVFNFGHCGAPTTTERDTLLETIERVQPDLVVIGYCVNDPHPTGVDGDSDWIPELDRTYQPDSAEWIAFTTALADIARACRERKLPAPIYALLLQGDGDFNHPDRTLAKILEWSHLAGEAAEKAGFTVVSMEARFRAEGSRKRWVNPWDGHPDAQCNRVYAEELAKAIAERIGSAISRRAPQG